MKTVTTMMLDPDQRWIKLGFLIRIDLGWRGLRQAPSPGAAWQAMTRLQASYHGLLLEYQDRLAHPLDVAISPVRRAGRHD